MSQHNLRLRGCRLHGVLTRRLQQRFVQLRLVREATATLHRDTHLWRLLPLLDSCCDGAPPYIPASLARVRSPSRRELRLCGLLGH